MKNLAESRQCYGKLFFNAQVNRFLAVLHITLEVSGCLEILETCPFLIPSGSIDFCCEYRFPREIPAG